MKIGVYGGTFNPPHLGHVTAARAVSELLKLDKLLFIPAGLPPHKPLPEGTPSPEQRLEMTRLAAEQTGLGDRVETLDLEILRGGRSYTSETLELLRQQYPDDELWLLMGTDMFLTIQTWHDPARIFELAGIAAFGRTEEDTEELFAVQRDYLYRTYPNARIFTLTIPGVIDVSSTELRQALGEGKGGTLLPPAPEVLGCDHVTSDLDSVLPELDVVYMLRVQQERLEGAPFPTIREYHKLFGLTKDREKLMKPDAIICHPGPINRGVEFDSYMADHPQRSVILEQVYAGICVRMAILYLLLGGADNGLAS